MACGTIATWHTLLLLINGERNLKLGVITEDPATLPINEMEAFDPWVAFDVTATRASRNAPRGDGPFYFNSKKPS
jgi:hypothetical protein